ncbi:hypothetical protein [Paragemmobacter straminiformis]|uniref:Uncharacterized protein n=1 Tax=Paragemmobacter straminiformis TaxID=2045119 RepID=A0A842ID07_9RHOB|nr:hypothetical protein [Gemmobacter straminiformis]MBC2837406.1 hypothetical protein [Gemmobacter straminiformis]
MFVSRLSARLLAAAFFGLPAGPQQATAQNPVVSGLLETILRAARQAKPLRQKRAV